MIRRALRWKGGLLIAFLAFATSSAVAARITMKDGSVVECQILSETTNTITIKRLGNELTIRRDMIASIDEGSPGSTELIMANEALNKGDIAKAGSLIEAARQAGASEEDIAPIAEKVKQKRMEQELARFKKIIEQARNSTDAEEQTEAIGQLQDLLKSLSADNPAREEIVKIISNFHLNRATAFTDRVQYKQAVDELNQVIELDPERSMAYLQLADIYRQSSATWKQAIQNYGIALDKGVNQLTDMEKGRIYWELGEIYRQTNRWELATASFHQAYKFNPSVNLRIVDRITESASQFCRSLQGKDGEKLIIEADKVLAIRHTPELLELKGVAYAGLEKYQESTQTFNSLLELEPRRPGINYLIAKNYFAEGEILVGREQLLREIDVNPRNYDALVLLGEYALQRDDYEAAQDYFSRAYAIDGDKPAAALGLGKAYRQQELLEEAKGVVQGVIERLPENREANLEMGQILIADDKLDEAKTFFTKVLGLIDAAPEEEQASLKELKADALIARGEISLIQAGPGTAQKDFAGALQVLPNYGQAFYAIGRAYRKKYASSKNLQDLKFAEEKLLKARELESENPRFALELGILYAEELAKEDTENEKEYLRNAVENWQAYIDLGGANKAQVRGWIRDLGV